MRNLSLLGRELRVCVCVCVCVKPKTNQSEREDAWTNKVQGLVAGFPALVARLPASLEQLRSTSV